jgi:hypothetical protein
VLDPGGRLYQAGVGKIRRDLRYTKNLSPDDDAPLFAPRSIPDVLFNHHILMMSCIAGCFIVEVCEAKTLRGYPLVRLHVRTPTGHMFL